MAIWGIEGGVANAKLAIIPIKQIVAFRFNDIVVLVIIDAAIVATSVAVTIFEDKFVWIAAQTTKIINRQSAGRDFKWGLRLVCKKT